MKPNINAVEIAEMANACVLMRTRLVSRVVTGIYDQELRPFGLNSPQFALLVVIAQLGPSTRAEISRYHHQDRSTLTRNLQVMLNQGWIEEALAGSNGRGRPIVLTKSGQDLLHAVVPAWRAGQAQAKITLGQSGVVAIRQIADGIMNMPERA
jgi:DNA-binding MarR family transcriptional regulator